MSKGVTPVIATVLLLMMTVAAAGAAYLWMNSLQNSIQQNVEETYGDVSDSARIEFQFRYRKCNATEAVGSGHNEIEIIVENTGQQNIPQGPVSLVLVDDMGMDLEFVEATDAMTEDLSVSSFLSLAFNVTTDLDVGGEYVLRVGLPGGVTGSQFCIGI